MPLSIKPASLINLFEEYQGKKFVSLETKTQPKLKKTGRISGLTFEQQFGVKPETVFKYSKFVAGIGYNYKDVIEGRLAKDGGEPTDYQAGTSWHQAYNGSSVIRQHKTKLEDLYFYVTLIANNPAKSEYRSGDKVLDKDALAEFLDVPRKPTNQGLEPERTVEVRTLKLDSVIRFKGDGCDFIVE